MKARGRPPKELSEVKNRGFRLRFTEDEKEHLEKAAIDNQMTQADLIRTGLVAIDVLPPL